jgi:MinD-like ATPase involved in chromosome partitioning or flagellar assembly
LSQRIFVVVGAKGGVGATTIATELVQRFPAQSERVIVDADLTGKRSLAVWYDLSDDLDVARVIGSATVAVSKAGALVMELARTYEDGLIQTKASVSRAFAALSENALVVVDAPQPFAAVIRPFVVRATKIIVVAEPTTMGVATARSVLAAMDRFGIVPSRIALVVSDIRGRSEVSRTEMEGVLRMPVSAELPNRRDRRYAALFDGLVTMLVAAPPFADPTVVREKPAFDRRNEPAAAAAFESGDVFS